MDETDKIRQEVEGHMQVVREYLRGNANPLENRLDNILNRLTDIEEKYPDPLGEYTQEIKEFLDKLGY